MNKLEAIDYVWHRFEIDVEWASIHLPIDDPKGNYSASCWAVPGCIAVGDTIDECLKSMSEALDYHFEGIVEDQKEG